MLSRKFIIILLIGLVSLALQACFVFGIDPAAEQAPGDQGANDRAEDEMEFTEEEVEPSISDLDSLPAVSDPENILIGGTYDIVYSEGQMTCINGNTDVLPPIDPHPANFQVLADGNVIVIQGAGFNVDVVPFVNESGEIVKDDTGASYEGRFNNASTGSVTVIQFQVVKGEIVNGRIFDDPLQNLALDCPVTYNFWGTLDAYEIDFSGGDE